MLATAAEHMAKAVGFLQMCLRGYHGKDHVPTSPRNSGSIGLWTIYTDPH